MPIPFAMTLLLAAVFDWQRLPAIPDAEGFAGSFAGASGDALLVAGGANFPRGRPWEGGAKVWHDRVFVLPDGADAWRSAGRLPAPLGYGVSVTHAGRVVCCGGSDDARHHAVTFALVWDGARLSRTDLPPLPRPLAQHCGALLGSRLYVVGGTETPTDTAASGRVFWLDLARPADGWREAEPLPGRILAVAGVAQETLYVCGGAGLRAGADGRAERIWLRDAYRLDPDTGWRRIADLPRPRVAAPSPATAPGAAFMILGGDDGGERETLPDRHPGFRREVLAYDPTADRWNDVGALPFALVTTPAVPWRGGVVIPGGEARPGVRSTEVWWAAPTHPSAERSAP